tara:strand:- start:62 stop:283 length:222 start_codon:yes stop_codon:yes gene_type:complete
MIGYILTTEQYDQIQGKEYAPYQCFNCVQDIQDIWFTFLTELDKETILNTEWNWILNLPQSEYVPKPAPPFPR